MLILLLLPLPPPVMPCYRCSSYECPARTAAPTAGTPTKILTPRVRLGPLPRAPWLRQLLLLLRLLLPPLLLVLLLLIPSPPTVYDFGFRVRFDSMRRGIDRRFLTRLRPRRGIPSQIAWNRIASLRFSFLRCPRFGPPLHDNTGRPQCVVLGAVQGPAAVPEFVPSAEAARVLRGQPVLRDPPQGQTDRARPCASQPPITAGDLRSRTRTTFISFCPGSRTTGRQRTNGPSQEPP